MSIQIINGNIILNLNKNPFKEDYFITPIRLILCIETYLN